MAGLHLAVQSRCGRVRGLRGLTLSSPEPILMGMSRICISPGINNLWTTALWLLAAAFSPLACTSSVEPLLTRWEGSLLPVSPGGVFGEIAAVTQFGRTQVSILVQGGQTGISHGWRIDSGNCQESGAIQGGAGQYPPLVPGEDASASADAVLAALFRAEEEYSARVFVSGEGGAEQILACGNLRLIQ